MGAIDFNQVPDRYRVGEVAIQKGDGRFFCKTCHKTLDEKNFFHTIRTEKFPNGLLPECKSCMAMLVDDSDPDTFLPILKEVDVPYIPGEWRALAIKKAPSSGSIIGKYVSKMHLAQYKKYHWIDSAVLYDQEMKAMTEALRYEGLSQAEAEIKAADQIALKDVPVYDESSNKLVLDKTQQSLLYGLTPENSKYGLSQEEIDKLKADWGDEYTEDQFLKLEQFYHDMKAAYVIQDPIAVSNARMIAKMTVKMNKFLDIDDVESASKLSRQLDLFIKSANLAPVQQKDRQQTTFAISQLAYLVEREGGFIPTYYDGTPKDKIDMILKDMQDYTEYLVRGESNIAEMAENAAAIIADTSVPKALEDYDEFAELENEVMGDLLEISDNQKEVLE